MPPPLEPDYLRGLLEHGDPTDKQRAAVEATLEHGNYRAAAKALGSVESNVAQHVSLLRKKAARKGFAPEADQTHPAPDGQVIKGVSTLYGPEGEVKAQWTKTSADHQRQLDILREAVEALKEDTPRAKPEKPPQSTQEDLAACYVVSDYHLGQLSWGEECGGPGEDWDTDIAEDMLVRWFGAAIDAAPKAQTGILAQLGDFLHHDGVGLEAVTPTSHNILDADTRFQRLVRVAIRSLRRVIALMLRKHEHVHVLMCEGNHDIASSVWLREMFATLYADEPRITVDTSPEPYYCVELGQTSLFFHHQHKSKMGDLSRVFAGKFREVFGRTSYSYAHVGHLHHTASKEDQLMVVEQHETLSSRDAHSSRAGYSSQRGASVITYSRRFGEVGRATIRPEMIRQGTA